MGYRWQRLLLRWLLDPMLEDGFLLVTLFGAMGVAVWIGGYRPALVVGVLGCLACDYLFIEPRGEFGFRESRNLVGFLLYVATGLIIVFFGEALHRARGHFRRAEGRRGSR